MLAQPPSAAHRIRTHAPKSRKPVPAAGSKPRRYGPFWTGSSGRAAHSDHPASYQRTFV